MRPHRQQSAYLAQHHCDLKHVCNMCAITVTTSTDKLFCGIYIALAAGSSPGSGVSLGCVSCTQHSNSFGYVHVSRRKKHILALRVLLAVAACLGSHLDQEASSSPYAGVPVDGHAKRQS